MFGTVPGSLWPDDVSASSDSQSPWNTVPGDSTLNPPPTTAPWMTGAEVGPQPPWAAQQRYIDTSNNWAAGPDFLRGPAAPPFNDDPPAPGFRVAPPIDTTPGFNVAPPVDTTPGFRVTDDDPSTPGFRIGNDFPQAATSYLNSYTPLKYDALPGSSSDWPSYDPAVAAPHYPSLQEILDRSARLYDGGNRNQISGLDGGRPEADGPVDSGSTGLPIGGSAIDPSYIVPAQSRLPTPVPPRIPGIGDNNPPSAIGRPNPIGPFVPGPSVQAPPTQRPPSEQSPPDTAGPAAAAAAAAVAAEQKRAEAFQTSREQLKALDPDNPLLKTELAPGVVPDQPTVDHQAEEVAGLIRKRFSETLDSLSAESTYKSKSKVRTIGGDIDLKNVFDYLKIGGKRIVAGGGGQYAEGGDGEFYQLPGGAVVAYRMADNDRTGEKRSIPTLDLTVPGRGKFKFHYNNEWYP